MLVYFIIGLLLFNSFNLKLASKNPYDYSSYKYISTNEDLSGKTLSSTESDESVIYNTKVETITLKDCNINKESGDSSKIEDSELYGINAAILNQEGNINLSGGQITSKSKGSAGLFMTNEAKAIANEITITTTGDSSCGITSTYGGILNAKIVTVNTNGANSHAISVNEKGEKILCEDRCILNTKGEGSHLIYLKGEQNGSFEAKNSIGTAENAKIAVIDGTNTFSLNENSNFKCSGSPNDKENEQCAIMLYQSGNKNNLSNNFNCEDSTIEILGTSKYYSTSPIFFITNTQTSINLERCKIKYGSNKFMIIKASDKWGEKDSNGGSVILTLTNQNIEGDLITDSVSSLSITLKNSNIKGKINPSNTAKFISIILDKTSSITITGDSFCNSINNEKKDGSNLINGTYSWKISLDSAAEGIFKSNLIMLGLSLILNILIF